MSRRILNYASPRPKRKRSLRYGLESVAFRLGERWRGTSELGKQFVIMVLGGIVVLIIMVLLAFTPVLTWAPTRTIYRAVTVSSH